MESEELETLKEKLSSLTGKIVSLEEICRAHEGNDETERRAKIKEMVDDSEKIFKEVEEYAKDDALYWFLLGRMLRMNPDYVDRAIDALKTACEKDPDYVGAWNVLGECYWDKMEVDTAKDCFQRALDKSVNKASLRNLSVIMRFQALKTTGEEKVRGLNEALSFAKRALDLDPTDMESWIALGNSYLSTFFSSPFNKPLIHQAIACYNQAERNMSFCDYVLFYNKAVAMKYLENYSSALEYLSRSAEGRPNWDLPQTVYNGMIQYLKLIRTNIGRKGRLKPKKYSAILKDLGNPQVGPYSKEPDYDVRCVRDLKVGQNPKALLFGKVLWAFSVDDSTPLTIGLLDANEDEIVVTIFNFNATQKFLKVGDSLSIPEPDLELVEVLHKQKEYRFRKVRVDNPLQMVVNDKKLPLQSFVNYNFSISPN